MSKYSITATKQDYANAFATLEGLEKQLGEKFNWKKIKRVNLDELVTLISILKRKLPATPAKEDNVFIGRLGHAIDFFDEHEDELWKYAKTKGMFTSADMKKAFDCMNRKVSFESFMKSISNS